MTSEVHRLVDAAVQAKLPNAQTTAVLRTAPWGEGPMPAGWFTDPVHAWKSMAFTSDLCTPGHPLCMLTTAAVFADRRAARLGADEARPAGMRAFRFIRKGGSAGAPESIWRYLRQHGGTLAEAEASSLTKTPWYDLLTLTRHAVQAGVLKVSGRDGARLYALGPVLPVGVPAS